MRYATLLVLVAASPVLAQRGPATDAEHGGFTEAGLGAILARAQEMSPLTSLIIARHGQVVTPLR